MQKLVLVALLLYGALVASAQATGNTTLQPDIIIPFTFVAAGVSFPATPVNNGPGDNRQRGASAWTMKYQCSGFTGVSMQVDSGASTSTTVTFGAFAGTIKTGHTNPVVNDTGGETQMTNGTAAISWVRVTIAATGAGTCTGVLYGWRNTSAAVTNSPGALPAGCPGAGSVELYLDATHFTCSTNLQWVAAIGNDGQFHAGGASTDPFTPTNPQALDRVAVALTGTFTNLTTSGSGSYGLLANYNVNPSADSGDVPHGFQVAISTPISLTHNMTSAVYGGEETVIHNGSGTVQLLAGHETDVENNGPGLVVAMYGQNVDLSVNQYWGMGGGLVTTAYGYSLPSTTNGIGTLFGFWSGAQGGGATNAFPLWFDEPGVFAVHSINTFNAVYQARPALYNPQFAKFTPGLADFERVALQFESNEAWLRTEAGGTGTARRMGLGALAGLDLSTNNVANPFTMPKMSAAAAAPGAAKCDLRLLAGTNANTGKIVINCGTSATEVTIADNIGTGF
jgi:hypothetical protein